MRVIPFLLVLTWFQGPVLLLANKDLETSAGVSVRTRAKSTQLAIAFGLALVGLQVVYRMVTLQE